MNKRGMSNLIATSLIIMITAFIGTMLLIWVTGFVKAQQYQALSTTIKSMDCGKINYKLRAACLQDENLTFLIDNLGTKEIEGIRLRIFGDDTLSQMLDSKIKMAEIQRFSIEYGTGNIDHIETLPVIKVGNKDYTCNQKETFFNIKPC